MIYLLDVNVLIALGDSNHPHQAADIRFFERCATLEGWATCQLTENALIRIFGSPNHPHGPGSTSEARRVLTTFRAAPGHQFWPDDLSFAATHAFANLPLAAQLTDLYLVALAVKRGGKLATFHQRMDLALLTGGAAALHLSCSECDTRSARVPSACPCCPRYAVPRQGAVPPFPLVTFPKDLSTGTGRTTDWSLRKTGSAAGRTDAVVRKTIARGDFF